MAKVRWDWDGDAAVAASDIDDYEDEGALYDGPKPTRGIFKFEIAKINKGESKAGNPKLQVSMKLVSRNKEDKQFDGCPLTDFLPIMKSTVWRFAPFLKAIGVTGAMLLSKTIVDENKDVVKIGTVKPNGMTVVCQVQLDENSGYLNVKRYLVPKDDALDDAADDAGDADDSDDDGDEPF